MMEQSGGFSGRRIFFALFLIFFGLELEYSTNIEYIMFVDRGKVNGSLKIETT